MITKNIIPVLAICIALLGCASPMPATFDYDTAVDFAALKTFSWMPATGNAATDELLVKKIRNSVDTQLQAKGRKEDADNPDFLIAMELSGKTVNGGSTAVGMSVGLPVGRAGTISVGGGKSRARETKEGTLILAFVDAKSKSQLWRATASAAVKPAASPEEQQQRIDEVIAEMFEHFPPKK